MMMLTDQWLTFLPTTRS